MSIKGIRGLIFRKNRRVELVDGLETFFDFKPSKNELLVKMLYSPINPSDVYSVYSMYHDKKQPPSILGFEGFGEVLEVGELVDPNLIGRKINCMFFNSRFGSYASHSVVKSADILNVYEANHDIAKNYFLVNPITAMGLKDLLDKSNSNSFIQTGASTTVAKALLHLANKKYNSINIIRSSKHADYLKSLGATEVITSSNEDFSHHLKDLVQQYKPLIGFDCVGAEITGSIFNIMPYNSLLYVYGALGLRPISGIDPQQLIFTKKQIKGFHLYYDYLSYRTLQHFEKQVNDFYSEFNDETSKHKEYKLEDYKKMLGDYRGKKDRLLFLNN